MTLDLPLIWAGIIAVAVFMYVLLDGFDLGVGILFPFAASPEERTTMMDTIAPVWDGNETWLVLGGGGLLAAFPAAYALLMPALYLPVYAMLMGLILRGVAFEFRLRGRARGKRFWTAAFTAGSLTAAFCQGLILGGFIQGVRATRTGAFAGGAFDWLTPYTLLVACGVVAGYALLGAAWLLWKTEDELHGRARRWTFWSAATVALALAAVSLATLFLHPDITERWGIRGAAINWRRLLPLLSIPALGLAGLLVIAWGLRRHSQAKPYLGAVLVFLSGYLGLAVGFFPYVAPYALTFRQAASEPSSLGFMLVGVSVLLPLILGYTAWVYWVFRGKVSADAGYH
ncbi:MAG TPA: cytochrome d ubiquinol oxidase subunit II [Caulobacteraceae bacterium]|jgi:cytochrome d ubiquinol oxidase subunit II